jgi:hypothetical protein
MTPKEENFIRARKDYAKAAAAIGVTDPFNFGRGNEAVAAIMFGHTISPKLAGADAINEKGELVEYKSTIRKNLTATYNGISVQPTWEKLVEYLKEKKILNIPEHYCWRTDEDGDICEAYKLKAQDVYDCLLPKMKRSYENRHNRKDPRVAASLSNTEIKKYGRRVI